MATATQIKELLKTHGEGDDERFYAIAMQVAAAEARQGHELLAQDLRHLVEKARMRKNQSGMDARIVHLAQPALTPNFRPRSGKYKVESAPFFSRLGGRQGRRFPLPSRSAARPRRGGPKGRPEGPRAERSDGSDRRHLSIAPDRNTSAGVFLSSAECFLSLL